MYVAHFGDERRPQFLIFLRVQESQVTSPEVSGGTGQLFRVVPQELDPYDGCEILKT